MKTRFLFEVWPYAALAIFVAGGVVRCALACIRTDGIASGLTDARAFCGAGRWWRAGLLVLLLGHLTGLLFPREVLRWNVRPARLYLLEGVAFAAGIGALGGWARIMWRHLSRSSGPVGGLVADTMLLSFLFSVLVSGLLGAILYRGSSSWGVLTVTPYALSVLRGRPVVALAEEMPFLVQLHIFCALASAAILPFTRVAPLFVHAARRALGFVFAPFHSVVRQARTALSAWIARQNPAAWIWPEED